MKYVIEGIIREMILVSVWVADRWSDLAYETFGDIVFDRTDEVTNWARISPLISNRICAFSSSLIHLANQAWRMHHLAKDVKDPKAASSCPPRDPRYCWQYWSHLSRVFHTFCSDVAKSVVQLVDILLPWLNCWMLAPVAVRSTIAERQYSQWVRGSFG